MSKRVYYTLAVYPKAEGQQWSPQFGDYDKAVVVQEMHDTKRDWPKGSKFRVIKTGDSQADVNAGIDALNSLMRAYLPTEQAALDKLTELGYGKVAAMRYSHVAADGSMYAEIRHNATGYWIEIYPTNRPLHLNGSLI